MLRPTHSFIERQLSNRLKKVEEIMVADVISINSQIHPWTDKHVRDTLEKIEPKRDRLAVILETPGGVIETTERIVGVIRSLYKEVVFIIPGEAMSAGTVLALSGDRVIMDYCACLGPIDPQIEENGILQPALAYLNSYDELNEKSKAGELSTAEYALINKLDLGKLYQFRQAKKLTVDLLKKWLAEYKFKSWKQTENQRKRVTKRLKQGRAKAIADSLIDITKWCSHRRAISRATLQNELKIKIENLEDINGLAEPIREYHRLMEDFVLRENIGIFIQTKEYIL